MNQVFYWCVDALKFYANYWGMTYEELNVWIFCIIEPIVFVLMVATIIVQTIRLRKKNVTIKLLSFKKAKIEGV